MLLSMTGYGEAHRESEELSISVEARSVNNRYLKVSLRAQEPYHLLEPFVEKVVRKVIRRGTIHVSLRCQRQLAPQDFQVNTLALASYVKQVKAFAEQNGEPPEPYLAQILMLPGVVPEPSMASLRLEEDWEQIEPVLREALDRLEGMRREEGRAMSEELLEHRKAVALELDQIRDRSPGVVEGFRDRLFERARGLLGELDIEIDKADIIREVSIFAERSDIAEEMVRLGSHLDQFQEILNEKESVGRKLEFLLQEMTRETNTIGSKASDVQISRRVVEIKGVLEKVRELVQNVE